MCKRYEHLTFSDHLLNMVLQDIQNDPKIVKLELSRELRVTFLEQLRGMNIQSASLFPDLDGFANSLRSDWEIERESLGRHISNRAAPIAEDVTE